MADKYPSATVEGLDLSAIQPTYVPPNLKFIIDDIEEEWVYNPNSYDYIHCRHVAQTIKNKPQLLERALRYVPGTACLSVQYSCDLSGPLNQELISNFKKSNTIPNVTTEL